MKKEDLFEGMTAIEEELLLRSEGGRKTWKVSGLKGSCVAAALVLLFGLGGYFMTHPAKEDGEGLAFLPGREENETGESLAQNSSVQEDSPDTVDAWNTGNQKGTGSGTGQETDMDHTGQENQGIDSQRENSDMAQKGSPDSQPGTQPGQAGTPEQVGFEAPKGGKEVAAGSVDVGMLLNKKAESAINETLCIATIPVGSYVALYEQEYARSQEVLETSLGAPVEGTENFYRLGGHTDLQYLIMKGDGEDAYTLWEFAYFLQDTEYDYGEVLRLVYDIDSAQDITQIISRPANMDGSDQGKALQKKIGEKTIEDREQIESIYQAIASMTCLGGNRWDLVGLGGDEPEQMLQAVKRGRYLTLVTSWDNEIDKLKYTGITGRFYQYSGVAYDVLSQEDKEAVEEILGIE